MSERITFGKSDIGLKRSNNEDALVAKPEKCLLVVADGIGGAAAGEVASQIFAETAVQNCIIIIRAKVLLSLAFSLILTFSLLFADNIDTPRILPLPIAEVEGVLSRWLAESGFEISRTLLEDSRVQLRASKGSETWQIILRPHSPLASFVQARYTQNTLTDQTKFEALWAYLQIYLKSLSLEEKSLDQGVPDTVLSQSESVVCIKAMRGGEPIQFSGFIIDRKGAIISTAHDLKGVQDLAVILSNGQEVQGRLVRRDPERDLVLIRTTSQFNAFISLAKVRTGLDVGEKIFFAGCPMNHQRVISWGIVERSLKQVNDLPLWEVKIEILPGSSGSPAFDAHGNLVGVVKGRYRGTDSVGFLIPVDSIIEFLKKR